MPRLKRIGTTKPTKRRSSMANASEVVERGLHAWRARDAEAFASIYSDDAVMTAPGGAPDPARVEARRSRGHVAAKRWAAGSVPDHVRVLAAAAVTVVTLALAACASGASRPVPQGFWGANWSFEITSASPQMQERNWDRMAQSGVESQRALFLWSVAQPNQNSSFDFSQTDRLVQ